MSYIDALKEIQKNKHIPVILLYGEEDYFIQQLKRRIIEQTFHEYVDDHEEISTYDLEEVPIEVVIQDAETYPFFHSKKLIFAYHPIFLTSAKKSLPIEHNLQVLEQYLLDRRRKLTKLFNKTSLIAHCDHIRDRDIEKWIHHIADHYRVTVERGAVEVLGSKFLSNLQIMDKEIEKLATYVGEKGVITKEIVQELSAHSLEYSALQLVDAVLDKNLVEAMEIYKQLMKMDEEPIALIGLLSFQFRTIMMVKILRKQGYNERQMQKRIGAHPYVIKLARKRDQRFSDESLKHIINLLAETDAHMKQGTDDPQIAFERLLFTVCQK